MASKRQKSSARSHKTTTRVQRVVCPDCSLSYPAGRQENHECPALKRMLQLAGSSTSHPVQTKAL